MPQIKSRSHGFTLIELLAVIAVIGILSAILVPVVSSMRKKGQEVTCASNMRQLGVYALAYAAEENQFPTRSTAQGRETWLFRFVEAGLLPEYATPLELFEREEIVRCPVDEAELQDGDLIRPSYAMNALIARPTNGGPNTGVNTFSRPINIREPSKLILIGGTNGNRDQKTYHTIEIGDLSPENTKIAFDRFNGRSNFVFADGHVESLSLEDTYDTANGLDLWTPTR